MPYLYPKEVIRSSENLYHGINVNLYQNAAIVVMVTVRRLKRCCVHFSMDKVKSLVLCFMLWTLFPLAVFISALLYSHLFWCDKVLLSVDN